MKGKAQESTLRLAVVIGFWSMHSESVNVPSTVTECNARYCPITENKGPRHLFLQSAAILLIQLGLRPSRGARSLPRTANNGAHEMLVKVTI